MPNQFNNRPIIPLFQVPHAHRRVLNPSSVDPDRGLQVMPITIDKAVMAFNKCYMNFDLDVPTSAVYLQNIAATSTVNIKLSIQYCSSGSGAFTIYTPDITTPSGNLTIIPNNGSNVLSFRDINLKGVSYNSGAGQDFEKLLLMPGFFKIGAYYDSSAPNSLGAGVSNSTINALLCVVSASLVTSPLYIT